MQKTIVRYRTTDYRYNQFAVVPTSWLSDLLEWLKLSECAEIVSTTDNEDSDYILPSTWPSYQTCLDYCSVSNIVASLGR